jgi:hypothetical protein
MLAAGGISPRAGDGQRRSQDIPVEENRRGEGWQDEKSILARKLLQWSPGLTGGVVGVAVRDDFVDAPGGCPSSCAAE